MIHIDCDACPNNIKITAIDFAKEHNIKVTLYMDYNHEITDDYAEIVVVDSGMDSVDFKIISKMKKGDIVITQDYGLASLVLSKKGKAISTTGMIYDESNIDNLLYTRHVNKKLRKQKSSYKLNLNMPKNENMWQSLEELIKE